MSSLDKLSDPVILRKIGKLVAGGKSYSVIQRILKEEDKIETGYFSVKKAYETYSARSNDITEANTDLKGELTGAVLDIREQLKAINDLCWELIKNARDQGKLNVINAMPAVRELMKQVEFQYKVLNRIESSFDFRKENNLALTQVIIDKLQMFEKDGFISVHSNPKEILDLEKLQFLHHFEKGIN